MSAVLYLLAALLALVANFGAGKAKVRPGAAPLRRSADITVEDIRHVGRQANALLEIVDRSDASLAEMGLTEVAREGVSEAARLANFKMPSCRAMMLAGLAGGMDRDAITLVYHRAQVAYHAALPALLWLAMQKADDENAPGSTKVILALLEGSGLLQPAEAVSVKKRLDQIDFDKLRERAKLDPAGLKAEILGGT